MAPRRYSRKGGASGAPAPRPAVVFKPPGYRDELCAFFRGTGTDIECRTLEQILTWDNQLMEVCHDYIQWLLPTDEASKFNSDAPILDPECQRIFREDEVMRRNYRRGAQRFLTFLGLSANVDAGNGEPPRIVKAPHFQTRILMCWRGPENHNWKRVSRALRSLGLVGMKDVQQALLTCLEEIIVSFPGLIDEKTIGHWLDEACVKSKLVHSITPGYVAALLGSKNMMASLCRQYFGKYDINGNGRLELDEIVNLTAELHTSLGLPSDAVPESDVPASIAEFGTDGRLSTEEFPLWFTKVLQNTIEQSEKVQVEEAEEKEQQVEPIRREYVTALLGSPALLKSLCTSYFNKYDRNHNGQLEPSEALRLSIELSQGLGVAPAFTTEDQVLASMSRFARGRTETALVADQFPDWFQDALRTTAKRRHHTV